MHHTHVNRKEKTMNRNILDEFYSDPAFYTRVVANAHRERSRAIAAGFAWLASYAKARLTPHIGRHPARWIARLG
jgi:hypothetical protein